MRLKNCLVYIYKEKKNIEECGKIHWYTVFLAIKHRIPDEGRNKWSGRTEVSREKGRERQEGGRGNLHNNYLLNEK